MELEGFQRLELLNTGSEIIMLNTELSSSVWGDVKVRICVRL